MGKWIDFILMEQKPKTRVWGIKTKEDGAWLGRVKWFGQWRRYAFFPENGTIYESQCLKDIAEFLDIEMNRRKAHSSLGK